MGAGGGEELRKVNAGETVSKGEILMDLKQINSLTLEQLKKLEREYQAKADASQRTTAELQRTAQRLRKAIIRKKQSASKV